MRPHLPTLWSGIVLIAIGVGFGLEAAGVWSFEVGQLQLIAPLALIAIGVGFLLGSLSKPPPTA